MTDQQFGYPAEGPRPAPPPGAYPPQPADPPPWIVSQPPPEGDRPVRPAAGRGRFVLVLGLAVLVLIAAAGGSFLVLRHYGVLPGTLAQSSGDAGDAGDGRDSDADGVVPPPETLPATEAPAPIEPEPVPTTEPPTEPATDPQREALAELEETSRQDLTRVSLNGQLVAQLASKNPGTYDRFQTTADGSHTFQATDILRQHEELRDDPANGGTPVVLLKSTDYGKRQLYHDRPLYVTFALGDFGTEQSVRAWCARRFPDLSGEALGNQCAVRRLRAP